MCAINIQEVYFLLMCSLTMNNGSTYQPAHGSPRRVQDGVFQLVRLY